MRKGEQLREQEAVRESGQTDGETEPRPPSVSDSRGPGGPPALMAQRDGAWVVGPESGGSRQGWL